MATKKLGHYEGEVEDINIESKKFQSLNPVHQRAIKLARKRDELKAQLEEVDNELKITRDALLEHINSGNQVDWAWIWNKTKTNVKWKEEFVKALGQPKADALTKEYKTKSYPQVGIQYIDPIPDSIVQIKDNPPKFPIVRHKLKRA